MLGLAVTTEEEKRKGKGRIEMKRRGERKRRSLVEKVKNLTDLQVRFWVIYNRSTAT